MTSNATHIASDDTAYRYPGLGDERPSPGTKVLVLTDGGICVATGWLDIPHFIAWAPMPRRNKDREALLAQTRQTNSERTA